MILTLSHTLKSCHIWVDCMILISCWHIFMYWCRYWALVIIKCIVADVLLYVSWCWVLVIATAMNVHDFLQGLPHIHYKKNQLFHMPWWIISIRSWNNHIHTPAYFRGKDKWFLLMATVHLLSQEDFSLEYPQGTLGCTAPLYGVSQGEFSLEYPQGTLDCTVPL